MYNWGGNDMRWELEASGGGTRLTLWTSIYRRFISMGIYLDKKIPLAGTAHQCGTVRFGNDPKESALDRNCKAHDLDNLYVVDGSFFPSSSAVNPALTIMANALRVGDHLIERMA